MQNIIETERLFLRKLCLTDVDELSKILMDDKSMQYYPRPFTLAEVERWVVWNLENYKQYNHGLWAVLLKSSPIFLGDCGITIQNIEDKKLPELGYHIKKEYCKQGFATEAAKACIEYAFKNLGIGKLFTYTKYDNIPARRVAEKIGMKLIRGFKKRVMNSIVDEVLYCIEK